MLIYCMKCEAPNEEDETFCVECNNALKAIPVPEKVAPWKKVDLQRPGAAPGYRALQLTASVISFIGLLCLVPLPAFCIARLVSPDLAPNVPFFVWALLASGVVSGVLIIGFSELLNCVRDIARNSYR